MATVDCHDNQVGIMGEVTFDNVLTLRTECEQIIASHNQLQFDLSQVETADSSILALIVALRRFAKHCHSQLDFINAPAALQSLVAVCGASTVFQLAE